MKSKNLLFILGAGASAPYGLPGGKQLVQQILHTNLENTFKDILVDLGITDGELHSFQEDLRLADLSSIDAFLENNARYVKVGKIIIAYFLGRLETYENLYSSNREDNWYQYLVDKMLRNYPFPEIEKNNISFITYNYDRSLEFYLYNALKRSNQSITEEECITKMSKFPVLHLHGSMGTPKYSSNRIGKPYEPNVSPNQLLKAAEEIHIISEKVEIYAEFQQAYNMISGADRLIFLGFGYHPTNLHRLKLDEYLKPDADLWGTAYGYTESEKYQLITEQFRQFRGINLESKTCTGLLSTHIDLIIG